MRFIVERFTSFSPEIEFFPASLCVILVLLSGRPCLGLEGLGRFSHRVV